MATKLTNAITLTGGTLTTGAKDPGSTGSPTLSKWPEGGGTFSVESVGTTTGLSVQLRAWNTGMTGKEVLATFTLPRSSDSALYDSLPVFSTWDNFDWNVTALGTSTTTIKLMTVGVGV